MFNDNKTDFQRYMEEMTKAKEQRRLAKLQQQYSTTPDFANMSLRDELNARFDLDELKQLQQKYGAQQASTSSLSSQPVTTPQYGDATAKALNDYLKDYKTPQGQIRTGLVAPINDMVRNYNTMKAMKLKESDPFFHCKANYEAASRGVYGTAVANTIDVGKELWDIGVKKRPLSNSLVDYNANLRGQIGAWKGQTLEETCPTHHKYYK